MPTTTLSPDRRYLCSELVTVRWTPSWGPSGETVANLEEIWGGGASMLAETGIPENALVRIEAQDVHFRGMVRCCRRDELGFIVEVDFLPNQRWDPRRYLPEHLFDPGVLLGYPTLVPAA
ncbi:MAG: hypothetical protein SFV54_28465 [Bryobacteraceae bacterium]|nr:hypothetical protein [Bryobacteraceae bacterium]